MEESREAAGASDRPTVKQRFKALIAEAEQLEKYSDPNSSAGPSFWRELDQISRTALSVDCIGNKFDERDFLRVSQRPEFRQALSSAYDEFKSQIWKRAAELLRKRAADLKAELQKEASDIAAMAESLEDS